MPAYARLDPNAPGATEVRDFDAPPPAAKGWLPLIVDAQPVANASQVVVGPVVVIANGEAHATYSLRSKTQAELDAESQATELTQLKAMLSALSADIAAGITPAPTTAAQAFVEIQDLKRRALRTDRAIRWLLLSSR